MRGVCDMYHPKPLLFFDIALNAYYIDSDNNVKLIRVTNQSFGRLFGTRWATFSQQAAMTTPSSFGPGIDEPHF